MPKKAAKPRKEPLLPEDKDIRLKHLYTIDLGDKKVKYYTYANEMSLPKERVFMGSVFTRYANMNITKDTLSFLLKNAKELIDKNKVADAGTVINEILSRMELYCEEETLKSLAAIYVVREGENPDTYSDEMQELKKKEISSSLEAKGFFLDFAFRFTESYSANSELSILSYLAETVIPITRERVTTPSHT